MVTNFYFCLLLVFVKEVKMVFFSVAMCVYLINASDRVVRRAVCSFLESTPISCYRTKKKTTIRKRNMSEDNMRFTTPISISESFFSLTECPFSSAIWAYKKAVVNEARS